MLSVGTVVTVNTLNAYRTEIQPTLPCAGVVMYAYNDFCIRYHVKVLSSGKYYEVSPDEIEEVV